MWYIPDMHIIQAPHTRVSIRVLFLTLLLVCMFSLPAQSQDDAPTFWNQDWSYRQQLNLPIDTRHPHGSFQPIDLQVTFTQECWALNDTVHSIRICCWHNNQWEELESQIYDLSFAQELIIESCSIIFIIPEYADGSEQYWLYYDDHEVESPNYPNRVDVKDKHYSFSPIADISIDVSYYGIYENNYCLYGVGQEGDFLRRSLSQVVVKQLPNSESFDLFNIDQIASFSFSMQAGEDESDEVTSECSLISKKIFTDGNLMVEFGIISESQQGEIRTTAMYKYYYNPGVDKRLCVHVRHEVNQDLTVKGIENLDGRYGSFATFKSRNPKVDSLNFGEIFPSLYFTNEQNIIEQYQMITNPESKDQEWIIDYDDDADLHGDGWIAYGDNQGTVQSLLFSTTEGIVKQGVDERDGIQVIVAEREYFDFLGTEIDYATINYGRNSYEPGSNHDIFIPDDFVVEYDVEFFTASSGGIEKVEQEAHQFRLLSRYRHLKHDPGFEQQEKTVTLTVIPHFGGVHFTFPLLANITDLPLPVMWVEVWKDDQLIQQGAANRSLLTRAYKTFHELPRGTYVVKVYYRFSNQTKLFRGTTTVELIDDTRVHVLCTWQRTIHVQVNDQDDQSLEHVLINIYEQDGNLLTYNSTDASGYAQLTIPKRFNTRYTLEAYYGDFLVHTETILPYPRQVRTAFSVPLYDLEVTIRDTLGLPPGVDVNPILTSISYENISAITPKKQAPGHFLFSALPSGRYLITLAYGSIQDTIELSLPEDGPGLSLMFSPEFKLKIHTYDNLGNPLDEHSYSYVIQRGTQSYDADHRGSSFPPAQYTVFVLDDETVIGMKSVELTSSQTVNVLTTIPSMIPTLIGYSSLFGVAILLLLTLFKVIAPTTLIKGIALFVIAFSLVQPWWSFQGENTPNDVMKSTEMYVQPGVIIEETSYQGQLTLDMAALPAIFSTVLLILLSVILFSFILVVIGTVLSAHHKPLYAGVITFTAIIFLMVSCSMYLVVTDKLSETSVGSLQGEGSLEFSINEKVMSLQSSWGLVQGFYGMVFAVVLLLITTFAELFPFLRTRYRQYCKA